MTNQDITIHEGTASLSAEDRSLLRNAEDFLYRAYAPYSGFLVGAAIRTKNGSIAGGANQENASYPLCMCGERVALYHCAMQYPGEPIEVIAVVAHGKKVLTSPAPPCGACLQVLHEFQSRQNGAPIRLLLKADSDVIWEVPSLKVLLPHSFDGSFLE